MFFLILAGIIAIVAITFNQSAHFTSDAKIGGSILAGVLIIILTTVFFVTEARAQESYPDKPNPNLTQGNVASVDVNEVCEPKYTERARRVTASTKRRVYKLHRVDKTLCRGGCKIDHLIPLAVGGSNHISNLWPHEYGAKRSVFAKSRLEVRLRKEVCSGNLNIVEAQQCIATDWHACFDRFYPGVHKQ